MSSFAYPNPQAIFYQQYEAVRRDEVVGILLALFLGSFGAHHFYLRRTGLGILYLCFFWTGIPAIVGLVECFFMPARVREFNAIQAAGIAAALGIPMPIFGPADVRCSSVANRRSSDEHESLPAMQPGQSVDRSILFRLWRRTLAQRRR